MKTSVIGFCVFVSLACLAGTRPYEFDWANRVADDRRVLLPLVSAEGFSTPTGKSLLPLRLARPYPYV